MESAKQFFCHTCKKTFSKVILSEDDEVTCNVCGEYFVEMIEDTQHLQTLKNIYTEEQPQPPRAEEQKNNQQQQQRPADYNPQMEWLNNLSGDIEQLMRDHGQQTTMSANGHNVNVTTMQGQSGNAHITIANIDGLPEENLVDGEDGDEWEDVPELEGIQQINVEIQIDDLPPGDG